MSIDKIVGDCRVSGSLSLRNRRLRFWEKVQIYVRCILFFNDYLNLFSFCIDFGKLFFWVKLENSFKNKKCLEVKNKLSMLNKDMFFIKEKIGIMFFYILYEYI